MFTVGDDFNIEEANKNSWVVEENYIIQKNDRLNIEVFTNGGERIIDPNLELAKDLAGNQASNKPQINYLVNEEGMVRLPQIKSVKLEGLTIAQAEDSLEKKFNEYYEDPFVKIKYLNKRAILLGAAGGRVIPLENENTSLMELLALSEGIDNDAKVQNIRVIRGEDVFIVDLSTVEGMKKSNFIIQPGDVVYVEPIRRPLSESLKEYGPVISIITSLATLLVVILNSN